MADAKAAATADERVAEAPIEGVTVHQVGATVTRRMALDAPVRTVRVVGLPLALHDETARVQVRAEAGEVWVGSVRVGLHARPPSASGSPPTVEAVRAARRAVQRTEQQMAQIDAELALCKVGSIRARPEPEEGRAPSPSPTGARLAWVGFVDGLTEARHAERAELAARLETEQEALSDALDRQQRASSAEVVERSAVTKQIEIGLQWRGEVRGLSLSISYGVPGARWVPGWQLRLDRGGERATIEMRAHVAQATGEDWSGVKLRLSTAQPSRFTRLPKLRSIRIGKAQPEPPPAPAYRPPPRGADALYVDLDRDRKTLGQQSRARVLPPALVARSAALGGLPTWMPRPGRGPGAAGQSAAEMEVEERAAPPAPMAAAAPPPAPKRTRAMAPTRLKRKRRAGPSAGFGGAQPGRPLNFAGLVLASPESSERGRLRPISATERFATDLTADGRRIGFTPSAVIDQARRAAAQVERLRLPAGSIEVDDSAGHYDYAWSAQAPVEVPGDGGWHSVPIDRREADCAVRYVVVPRSSNKVFRLASLVNADRGPLLTGPVEVYVDGRYALSTTLPTVPPGGRVDLGLGVEQGIRCARNTRFEERRSDARVVAMAELHHHIDVELANHLGRPASIEVRERLPQPADGAEVVVEALRVEPRWSAYDQTERGRPLVGGRRWQVTVPPGESQTLSAHYVVRIYAANALVGGNRREG